MPEIDPASTQEIIEGENVIIRHITYDDVSDFFALTRTNKALSPAPHEVLKTHDDAWIYLGPYLSGASANRCFAVMNRKGKLDGVIYTSFDKRNRRAAISWLFRPLIDRASEAVELFIESLNRDWKRRLEVEVLPGDRLTAELVLGLGFTKEANLHSYIYRNGRYYDVWLFSRLS